MDAQTLSESLVASAQTFCRSSLQAVAAGDAAVFLLHAGTALEHLSKSMLASLHPTLVVQPDDFNSLLHASGQGKFASTPPSHVRTITVTAALQRAGQVVPGLANLKEPLQRLVDGRNGVAHAALVDARAPEAVVVPFLRACDLLLAAMDRDRAEFWEDLIQIVDAREAASAEAGTIRALEKSAAARTAFEARFGNLVPDVRDALLLSIGGTYAPKKYEQTLVDCPVCSTPALVEGTIGVDWEPDWEYDDGEAYVAGAFPEVTIFPHTLECRACGLILDGEEELGATQVARSWKLEDVDPDDFLIPLDEGWLDV